MTKPSFAIFGASLLILSLAAPALALAEEARLPRAKVVSPASAAPKPAPAKDPDDDARHKARPKSVERDHAERGERHDAERRHDRD